MFAGLLAIFVGANFAIRVAGDSSIMHEWPLKVIGYNPLSASNRERQCEILDEFKGFDLVLVAGTGIRFDPKCREFEEVKVEDFRWLSSGFARSNMSNKSCGVAIALGSRCKNAKLSDPIELKTKTQGRGLAIRVRSGYYDLCTIVAYFPPIP